MSNIKGEMILIGCGGAGTSIVGNLSGHLANLGDGFSDIKTEYIDTSDANVKLVGATEDNFFLIKSINAGEDISGSGAIRAENARHIFAGANEFVNKKDFDNTELAKYYVLFASASGGSGSLLIPTIASNLLEKNLNVIIILVGDTGNKNAIENTLNTIASLNGVAEYQDKTLSVIYFNNTKSNGVTHKDKLANVDKEIFRHLTLLSAFLSGDLSALDQKDMSVFFNINKLNNIPAGLYALEYFKEHIKLAPHHKLRVVRTIITEDQSPDLNLPENVIIDHDKFGITYNENVISKLKEYFPIHYCSYANKFTTIEMELRDLIEQSEKDTINATVDKVTGTDKAKKMKNGIFI